MPTRCLHNWCVLLMSPLTAIAARMCPAGLRRRLLTCKSFLCKRVPNRQGWYRLETRPTAWLGRPLPAGLALCTRPDLALEGPKLRHF